MFNKDQIESIQDDDPWMSHLYGVCIVNDGWCCDQAALLSLSTSWLSQQLSAQLYSNAQMRNT